MKEKYTYFEPSSPYLISTFSPGFSFALLRGGGALLCPRGSRGNRKLATKIHETDFEIERGLAGLS